MIVDTHCHLNEECFDKDVESVISNLSKNNVCCAYVVGTDKKTSQKAIELASLHQNLYAIIGLYPEYADQYDQDFEDFLIENCPNPKVVAIGEIGLDFHGQIFDKQTQKRAFARQLQIAKEFDLPVSIHTREAFQDTFEVLKQNKVFLTGGSIHCFSGSPEVAREFVKLGFKLGFGGVCTFKNAKNVVKTLQEIDSSCILLETDAPYLAPEPYRGTRNEPKNTNIVLQKIADIKQVDKSMLEDQIFKNTKETFVRMKI